MVVGFSSGALEPIPGAKSRSVRLGPHVGGFVVVFRRVGRRLSALAAAGACVFSLGFGAPAVAAPADNTDRVGDVARVDTDSAIVRLSLAPLATAAQIDRGAAKRIDFGGSKTKAYRAQLAAQRNAFRKWLRLQAPAAKVSAEFDTSLNAVAVRLNGTRLATLSSAPGVEAVAYQQVYAPTSDDPDLARINALGGWSAAGATTANPATWAGHGVRVGIIDSGIDASHPCFADKGYAAQQQLGDTRYTNNKVVVARVFNNKIKASGVTAQAIGEHGTHVAGTVACNLDTPAVVDGVAIPYGISGVAPGALLGSYNIFPGSVDGARTEDIVNALDAAVADGMTVINMSLGGDAKGAQDLGTVAVDNLDQAGIVVAVAGGNEGDGAMTIDSPGSAERALTAGASTVGHYLGLPVVTGANSVLTVASLGDFPVPTKTPLSGTLAAVRAGSGLSTACSAADLGSVRLTGKIALVTRGECSFSQKVATVEAAGAAGVIVVNNVAGPPIAMGTTAGFDTTIDAVMAPQSDRDGLLKADNQDVTIGNALEYTYDPGFDDILAGFSSRGPVDVTYRVKPDVTAPGVNVLSAIPRSYCEGAGDCWEFMQGTSMATPHLSGMAAVVRQAHPGWAAWQVRSAIVNTADRLGVKDEVTGATPDTDPQHVGSGLADLEAAVSAKVAFSQTSVSFGAVAGGVTKTETVTVTNLGTAKATLPVSIKGAEGGGSLKVSATELTLAPGASETLTVTLTAPKRSGATWAHLYVGTAHAVLYAYAK